MTSYFTQTVSATKRALPHAWDAGLTTANAGVRMAMAARIPAATPKQESHQPRGQALT